MTEEPAPPPPLTETLRLQAVIGSVFDALHATNAQRLKLPTEGLRDAALEVQLFGDTVYGASTWHRALPAEVLGALSTAAILVEGEGAGDLEALFKEYPEQLTTACLVDYLRLRLLAEAGAREDGGAEADLRAR